MTTRTWHRLVGIGTLALILALLALATSSTGAGAPPFGPIITALNTAWTTAHPGAGDLVAFSINDDGMLIWLNDHSATATSFAKTFLLASAGTGNDITGNPKPYTGSGLATVYAGADAANLMGVPTGDSRVPDLIGIAQYGVVYTGKKAKIAEHGGNNPQDRWVPPIVSGNPINNSNNNDTGNHNAASSSGTVVHQAVETTQIAPTILQLLGLDSNALKAVQIEHTATLPLG